MSIGWKKFVKSAMRKMGISGARPEQCRRRPRCRELGTAPLVPQVPRALRAACERPEPRGVLVLDTNILFAALWQHGNVKRLVGLWKKGRLLCAVSPALYREYGVILGKVPRGRRFLKEMEKVLNDPQRTLWVYPARAPRVIKEDPSDNIVLACAKEARAGAIVSNDRHLKNLGIWEGIPILSSAQVFSQHSKKL